ncbi:MAG: elongation factor G [Nitrospirae bacterium]|nr:elongation factor G [Nitrospirota bacterium]
MVNFEPEKIRNIAVIAHAGAGKTSLVEAILFDSKATDRLGRVEDGNTITDYEPEEISRKISISSAIAFCDWKGYRINVIDTPGYMNFLEDTRSCLTAVDGAVVIVSALSGVKAETEKIWQYACRYELPRLVFVNKMDRENANFSMAVGELEKSFGSSAIPLNIPIGSGENFEGVIDLINMRAIKFQNGNPSEMDIPSDFKSEAEDYRKMLVEKIAESDDSLLERYLEGAELTNEDVRNGIRQGAVTRRFIPVLCGSATKNIGVHQLLDSVLLCIPSPIEKANITPIKGNNPKSHNEITRKPLDTEHLSAQVFKTIADPFAGKLTLFRVFSGVLKADSTVYNSTRDSKERVGQVFYLMGKKQVPAQKVGDGEIAAVAKLKDTLTGDTLTDMGEPILFEPMKFADPMISYAIAPKSKGDEEKVSVGLHRMLEEDPAIKFRREAETKEMILSGMGQMHLEITLERLKRKFGVDVLMKTPKIPYKETIKISAKAQGRYKRQSGGKGQYGDCWIEIEPLPRGSGFEFVDKIVGGVIPRQYIPAIEKGIVEAMQEGILSGYTVIDLRATVYDGSYHTVDSSEMAFKIAGSMAIKKAAHDAKIILLEPILKAEVITPDESLGNVIGDLNSRRGKVQGVEPQAGGNQKILALVPMSEVLTYANQLNSLTSGRGMYTVEFSHYEEVPPYIAQKIIAERTKSKKEEEN